MTEPLQLGIAGLGLGGLYALTAMGFAIVLRATRVLNMFQAGVVLIGGYLCYAAHVQWHLPFPVAVVVAMAICAALGALVAVLIGARLARASLLTSVLVTVGLLYVAQPVVQAIWGDNNLLSLDDPWGLRQVRLGGLQIAARDLWLIGTAAVVLAGVWYLLNRTTLGIAMRAAASDREAALAQGINPRMIIGASWAIAAALGALAGVMSATAVGGGVRPSLVGVAFASLPGMIVGGLSSTGGAAIGGVAIGLIQAFVAGYAPSVLGAGISDTAPYLLLLVVLLVRPRGLIGDPVVRSS